MTLSRFACTFSCIVLFTAPSLAADWPQWEGPDRNNISHETGLLKEWSSDGPPLAWKTTKLGGGYSAPSISHGRIFGMSFRGGDEVVWALSESDGKEQWSTVIGPAGKDFGPQGNEGPKCTPTVDGDFIFVLGVKGELACLKSSDGQEVWHKNLMTDFGGRYMANWGYCESPLVDGDKLICTPGKGDATTVALDKRTGETIWKSQVARDNAAGYASPIVINAAGHKQYVHFLQSGPIGVDAESGKVLWHSTKGANGVANCTTPIFSDDCVFISSAYGGGCALLKLVKDGPDGVKADLAYANKKMQNHHGGIILLDGCLYGASGGNEGGALECLDFQSGEVKWSERGKADEAPKGAITMADGRLYYRHESGTMTLLEPSPEKYIEHGRFEQPKRSRAKAWSYPVVANGKLYLRDQDVLFCYDVKAK